MDNIKLSISYTKEQIERAYRFHIFPTKRSRRKLLLFSVFIFGITLGLNLSNWFYAERPVEAKDSQALKVATVFLLVLAVLWLLVLIIIALGYFLIPGQVYNSQSAFKGVFNCVISNKNWSYIHEYNNGTADVKEEGELDWDIFTKKAENEEFIFLYKNKLRYIFPKVAFNSEADMVAFRQLLDQKSNIEPKIYK